LASGLIPEGRLNFFGERALAGCGREAVGGEVLEGDAEGVGFGGPGGVGEEFFEEAAEGAGFDLLEAGGEVGRVEGGGAEVAEVGVAVGVPEDVVGVEVAVIDVVSVEVMGGGGDAAGDGEGGVVGEV